MDIICENCRFPNSSTDIFCRSCEKPLMDQASILSRLIEKQESMEQKHQSELKKLKDEISILKRNLATKEETITKKETNKEENLVTSVEEIKMPIAAETEAIEQVKAKVIEEAPIPQKTPPPSFEEEVTYQSIPFEEGLKKILEPLHAGFSLLGNLYDKYKKEGKLPIFFMTIAGIIAILFGFGYLLQYSLRSLGEYAEVVKIALGFGFAFASAGFGIRLYLKNENYQEYGSALISLGIILNYLLIYFLSDLGNFPILSSGILGFTLIIANTGIAIFLSLKFKTKIIAVLFLLGGAFAPFYLNSASDGSLYYLYLWLLTIGANIVAKKIEWKTLHYLSFIVSLGLLEVMVFANQPNSILFTIYYHLFAYLFFYYTLFDKFSIRKALDKFDIMILAGNLSFLIYNLYTSHIVDHLQLGFLYILNAGLFGLALFKIWKAINPKVKVAFFIAIGAFVGLAVPALVDHSLMGLFWSIEAMALVILGFTYSIQLVRQEGYLVLLIALGKLIWSSSLLVENWYITIWHDGFLNYMVLGALIYTLWNVGQRYKKDFTPFEESLFKLCKEIIPIWISSVILISAYGLMGVWAFNLALIPAFGLVYWKKKFKTRHSDTLGIAHFLLLIVSVAYSVYETQSIHLSDQHLYAQISLAELMASLWFLRKYYELLHLKDSKTFAFSHGMRISFFVLLPLIFVHICRRHAIEYIAPGLWIAFLMAYFFHRKLQYKALLIELNILALFTTILSYGSLDDNGLFASVICLTSIILIEKGHKEEFFEKSAYSELMTVSPYVLSASITLLYFNLISDKLGTSIALFGTLLFTAVYFKNQLALVRRSHGFATPLASFFNLAAILVLAFDESSSGVALVLLNLILFGILIRNKGNWYSKGRSGLRWTIAIFSHQIQTLFFYGLALYYLGIELNGVLATVILVIHAILILFVSLKNQLAILNRLSFAMFGLALLKIVFNDIRDFTTAEKVIVLIVIGVLLLSASYAYLKLKKFFEDQNLTPSVESLDGNEAESTNPE